jgi:hypothetical protein
VICFPFDPTGQTGRKTKSGALARSESEKLNAWSAEIRTEIEKAGRNVKVVFWQANMLESLLLKYDASGGVRQYFFEEPILSIDWFKGHIASAIAAAGPRYTARLSIFSLREK